ncbi:MAG: DNA polymerase I [Planctomycetes bacterium]|nr:DNA polymerase I [Planctomycetota bacterium]
MSSGSETLYLIDAYSLIFQVFHALPEMSSPSGLPTNAVFGFTKDLLYLRDERKPTYLLCVFDMPGPTFRDEIYTEYKANRAPMPDDLQLQIPLIRQVLEGVRIPVLGMEGYEADDLIATLARRGAERGMDVYICSSDKDCRQLLSDHVNIFNLRKLEVYDREALLKDWGVTPEQVIDFQTLVGDSVDNVPGVPGIGPKTASKLLQDYKTLENLLAHVSEIPGKKQESLKAATQTIATSRKLVKLATDVPVKEDWEHWRVRPWDGPKLLELFRGFGFARFADMMRASLNAEAKAAGAQAKKRTGAFQGSLFDVVENGELSTDVASPENARPQAAWIAKYHLVDTPELFSTFLEELKKQPRFAIDLETTSLQPRNADLVGLAFSWREGEAWYVPVRGPKNDRVLDEDVVLAALRPILESERCGKINQNIKYDWQVLKARGIHVAGVAGDSMVADYLLHAGERSHNMEVLAEKHLQHRVIPISDLIGTGRTQRRMDEVPTARVAQYSGEDADVAWRLCARLEPLLQELSFKKPGNASSHDASLQNAPSRPSLFLYDDLEIPLIEVLGDMEFAGIRLDLPLLARMSGDMAGALVGLEREIHDLAGREFNIASTKQLREVLFEEKGFKRGKKTAILGEASTDQMTLEKLAREGHELPRKLLEQRKIAKLKSTYVDALPALVNERTGRVHASFNQTVASTGRLSSSDPNLQNIPIRSEQGEQIRQAFLPEEGWTLLTADYSQIELRLLAHLCGDAELRRAFALEQDIHARVAAQVFSVEEKDVTSAMRRTAKTINFGVIYGISAFGLAARLEISKDEAAGFIEAYFKKYPRVLAYQEQLLESCRNQGYVSTILGRRRAITGIRFKSSYRGRNQPEREAINMQVQGSAADLIKVAMVQIHRRLKKEQRRARMLLQIHDELVFEVPPEELGDVSTLVREEMTGALSSELTVPLGVDMGVGPNWLDVA